MSTPSSPEAFDFACKGLFQRSARERIRVVRHWKAAHHRRLQIKHQDLPNLHGSFLEQELEPLRGDLQTIDVIDVSVAETRGEPLLA